MSRVNLSLFDGQVKVSPGAYLGPVLFNRYRDTCKAAGSVYSPPIRANLVEVESVPRLVGLLQEAGFMPHVDEHLGEALKARAQAARKDMADTAERLAAVREAMRAQGISLYPFQEEGVAWLAPRTRALLADEMGLGKTVQALIAAPADAPVLVICPAVAKGVWQREARRWRPDLTPAILEGRGSFRWPNAGEIVITNYDILPSTAAEVKESIEGLSDAGDFFKLPPLAEPLAGTTLVADEVHSIKNRKAQRTERFGAIAAAVLSAGGRTWGLTGTPLLNKPPELWAILKALGLEKEAFGSWMRFTACFSYQKAYFGGGTWGGPTPEVPTLLRRVMLHRLRTEVLPDLPTKTYRDLLVPVDKEAVKAADKAVAAAQASGLDLAALTDTAALFKSGAAFEEMSAARAALAAAKVPALLELVEEFEAEDQPLVVFSCHRAPVDILGAREGWARISGDESAADRSRIEREFQAGALKGVAATVRAGGVAITLTRAHQAVFVDLDWTPGLNRQAEDRVCRIGQDRGVIITRLVADHFLDQRITELLEEKGQLIDESVTRAAVKKAGVGLDPEALERAANVQAGAAVSVARKPRRGAFTDEERWAHASLVQLAGDDEDRAADENGVGFNKLDNDFGHDLADQLTAGRGLTDAQWRAGVLLCRKYRKQIGLPKSEVA